MSEVKVAIRADTSQFQREIRRASVAMRSIASMFRRPARVERVLMIQLWPLRAYFNRERIR